MRFACLLMFLMCVTARADVVRDYQALTGHITHRAIEDALLKEPTRWNTLLLKIRFHITDDGRIRDVKITSAPRNRWGEDTARRALLAVRLPPVPNQVLAKVGHNGLYSDAQLKIFAADDAEILSRRVPGQSYHVLSDTICALQLGNASWGIPLWACDPSTLTISRVLGSSAPAPYAIAITTRPNDPMEEISSGRRLSTIHLLAASKEDALKMRRALIKEIESMQRRTERRQGNAPGYLKSTVRSQKR